MGIVSTWTAAVRIGRAFEIASPVPPGGDAAYAAGETPAALGHSAVETPRRCSDSPSAQCLALGLETQEDGPYVHAKLEDLERA
jgi:hypothetical protein